MLTYVLIQIYISKGYQNAIFSRIPISKGNGSTEIAEQFEYVYVG